MILEFVYGTGNFPNHIWNKRKCLIILKYSKYNFLFYLSLDHRLQLLHEREELKYSAEEKIVEDSDESEEDETIKKSVAQRREQIQKRLSIERQIPASTQKKEIVQEITEIKRQSLIEDKKAMHEEEIIMHAPTDNIIKSTSIPEQIIKLKSNIKEGADVSKDEFDKELQDKFKTAIKGMDEFEHKASDELQSHIHQTVQIESSKSQTDSKIYYDSTRTEKLSSDPNDKYAHEHITEKTSIADQSLAGTDSIKKTVTTIESKQPNEFTKTVEETAKTATEKDHTTHIDNKLLTERVIEQPNTIGDTQRFLQQEVEKTSIHDDRTQRTDSIESKKTATSIIDATRQFIESELTGKPSSHSDYTVVDSVVLESSRNTTKSGDGTTTVTVTKESNIEPIIDAKQTEKLDKPKPPAADFKPDIKVSKEVFTKDTNEDEFFKTIEARITKKMSQDLTISKDDIASIGKLAKKKLNGCIAVS